MYDLSEYISAIYVHGKPYGSSAGNLRVYIPSLMPSIGMGYPTITPISLNRSCYANASDCAPSVASMVNTQNFVTALAPYNGYGHSCYYYGSTLKVMAKTPDCLSCRLHPEEEDNSTYWPS